MAETATQDAPITSEIQVVNTTPAPTAPALPAGQDPTYDALFAKHPGMAAKYLAELKNPSPTGPIEEVLGEKVPDPKAAETPKAPDVKPDKATEAPKAPFVDKAVTPESTGLAPKDIQALTDAFFANEGKIPDELRRSLNGKGLANAAIDAALPLVQRAYDGNKAIVAEVFGSIDAYNAAIAFADANLPEAYRAAAYTMLRDLADPNAVKMGAEMLLRPYQAKVGGPAIASTIQGGRAPHAGSVMEPFATEQDSVAWYQREIIAKGFEKSQMPDAVKARALFDQKLSGMVSR